VSIIFFTQVTRYSEDSPRGNYRDLVSAGIKKEVSARASARAGYSDSATWILALQYAACFGVETRHSGRFW